MIRTISEVLALVAIVVVTGCDDASPVDGTCANDTLCADGKICAFGTCVDPSDQRLASVAIEIDTNNVLPVQTLFNVDLRASPRVDVALSPGVVVTGSVTDDEGVAVDAVVIAQPRESVPGRVIAPSSTTDATGGYTFLAVEGQTYSMTVSPADTQLPPHYDIHTLEAEADAGSTQRLLPLIVEEGSVILSGVVIAGLGAAASGVPGLDVRVRDADGRRLSSTARTQGGGADTLGRFNLYLVEGGAGLTLEIAPTAENAAYPTVRVPLEPAIEASVDLGEISLEGDGGPVLTPVPFRARVVDADGAPAAGATLSVRGSLGRGELATVLVADGDGNLDGSLPPGVYQAFVFGAPDNAAAGLLPVEELDVPSTNEELVFALRARVPFRGRVLDPDGDPLAGVALTVSRIGDGQGLVEEVLASTLVAFTGTSDASGQFDLAVDPGQYRVSTRPPPGSNAPAFSQVEIVGPGGFDRDIALPGRAFVAGTVLFEGAPVGAAYIRVFSGFVDERGAAILVGEGFADAAGAFEIVVPDLVASISNPDPP